MNKKQRVLMHKLTVLYQLAMETLDEIEVDPLFKDDFEKSFKPALDHVDGFLDQTMNGNNNPTKACSYIFELSKKVDTVIRKNYKPQ